MRRIHALRAEIAGRPHLAFAIVFAFAALVTGYAVVDAADRAGYLAGCAFALSASVVLLFAIELEETHRGH